MCGYIKLGRDITEWGWFNNPETLKTWIYIVSKANYKDGHVGDTLVKRGQLMIGRDKLAESLGLTTQKIRTILKRLEKSQKLTIKSTSQFTLLTVVNYDYSETAEKKSTSEITNHQPTTNQQLTIIQEGKERKERNNSILLQKPFEDFWGIFPTQRKGNKKKAMNAFVNALKRDSFERIYDGLQKYIISEDVANGFARGAEAWLNNEGWQNEYEVCKTLSPIAKPLSAEAQQRMNKKVALMMEESKRKAEGKTMNEVTMQ